MAFYINEGVVESFAEYEDVKRIDHRVFLSNKGLDVEEDVNLTLERATERILTLLSDNIGLTIDPSLIQARKNDFTELCVFYGLYYYMLPQFGDFESEEDSDQNKIAHYSTKFNLLFNELSAVGDWYDQDNDGLIEESESVAAPVRRRRVR